jgi:hypothetical protein
MESMKFHLVIAALFFAACNSNKPATVADDSKLSTALVSNPASANGTDAAAAAMKPVIAFKDTLHEFGLLHENETVSYNFDFTNTGKSPLIISSANGSCGCTVPDYPRDPIAPGKSATIKVTFNSAGKRGHQDKTVFVYSNALRATHMLYIKAEVKAEN